MTSRYDALMTLHNSTNRRCHSRLVLQVQTRALPVGNQRNDQA